MEHPGRRRWPPGDPYQVLGVDTGASQQDIARAYRRAAQHAHPDTHPHDRQAAAQFRALTSAYELLRDPGRRAAYDRARPAPEPSGLPPRSRPAGARPPQPTLPFLPGQLIWAGPVHIEPPTTAPATTPGGRGAVAAEYDDPVVILGVRPAQVWGWPW